MDVQPGHMGEAPGMALPGRAAGWRSHSVNSGKTRRQAAQRGPFQTADLRGLQVPEHSCSFRGPAVRVM